MLYVWFGETLVWEIWQDSSWTHWIVDWSTWLNADWSACFYGKLKSVPWTSGHLERLQSVQWFSFLRLSLAQMSSFPNGGFLSAPRADDCRKKSAIWSSASALKPDKCDKTFLGRSHLKCDKTFLGRSNPTAGSYQAINRSRVKCPKTHLNWHFSRAIFRQEVRRFLIHLPSSFSCGGCSQVVFVYHLAKWHFLWVTFGGVTCPPSIKHGLGILATFSMCGF